MLHNYNTNISADVHDYYYCLFVFLSNIFTMSFLSGTIEQFRTIWNYIKELSGLFAAYVSMDTACAKYGGKNYYIFP